MNNAHSLAPIHTWLAEPLSRSVSHAIAQLAETDGVRHVAVMPDVHLAADVCIGTVLATDDWLFPSAVGSDIGCGMAAVGFHADADLLNNEQAAGRLLAELYRRVPANKHSAKTAPDELPTSLHEQPLSVPHLEKMKRREGRVQLGTLGRGNHFLEFQADQQQRLWLMLHSGSRGIGQAIAKHHSQQAQRLPNGLFALSGETEAGLAYLADVDWALRYAAENRLHMARAVAELMQDVFQVETDWTTLIHANHNHVQRETHFDHAWWVHRKGAQSAQLDEWGVIPGSMGTASFHVVGRGCPASLHSCSHGAGRQLSRTDARRTISPKKLRQSLQSVWYDHRRLNHLLDEAPAAYKDIHSVLRAQSHLVRIVRELRPVLAYKGV